MKELQKEFDGVGEVKGKHFKQLLSHEKAYLYECTGENFKPHYEVFKARKNTMYGVISYPTSKSFGKWAWSFNKYSEAIDKFNELIKD